MLHGGVYQFQLLLRGTGQLLDIFQRLLGLELRQRDAADYAGIDRSTYIHYEEAGQDFYPKEHMEKLAELFEVPLENLLDDYNLFLLREQGEQIKAIRQRLGLTQKAYAAQLGVPLQKFKRWEQGNVQIFQSTWEKYFKQT